MVGKINLWMQILGVSAALVATGAYAADRNAENKVATTGEVLFKIHDIVPEVDENGNVIYCNVGATFFNRTNIDMANVALTLKWNDDVIGEIIDQEERAEKEMVRSNSNARRPRYSTSGTTAKTINASLKLPPLKSMQQVSLKTKVDTNRCFLLLNDMDIEFDNCGTASVGERMSAQGCSNLFQYVSPKMAEYYMEFKEISLEEQVKLEDAELSGLQKEMDASFDAAVASIKNIAKSAQQLNEQLENQNNAED